MKYPVVIQLFIALAITSCSQMASEEKTLWIGSQLVDCVGVAPMKCMQVKESEDGEWTLFYQGIEGFDYEEGNNYKVRVRITERENPPADASSLVYTLIRVEEKETAIPERTPAPSARADIYDVTWRLRTITEGGQQTQLTEEQEVTLLIKSETQGVSGKAACNNYFGGAIIDGTSITMQKMGSTRKMCVDNALMELETRYLTLLQNVNRISPDRSRFLTLQTTTGAELTYMPMPDSSDNE